MPGTRPASFALAPPPPPPRDFEISFDFRSIRGSERLELIKHLGLTELADRAARIKGKSLFGSGDLDYLVIQEQAASGMYGPWKNDESKLYKALVSVGFTDKSGSAGGSYGYGKAGLIRGSAIRTVIAYTCFLERADDPGVTRRLLGMTYWDTHHLDRESFTGFARYGRTCDEKTVVPFENHEADKVAAVLGLRVRDPARVEDLGTSLLLVKPTVKPEDLVTAIERSWWPALEDPTLRFHAVVHTSDGTTLHPRPKCDDVLRTFVDSYELATTPQDTHTKERRRYDFKRHRDFDRLGALGLVAEPQGWSYPEQSEGDTETDHRSLVALVRKPHMVVEYLEVGKNPPYVRGTFVADDGINASLRDTEPKGHDAWNIDPNRGDQNPDSALVAKTVIGRIKAGVRRFRSDLEPPRRPPEAIDLPHFDKIMKRLMSGAGVATKTPIQENRPLSIHLHYTRKALDNDLIELSGTAEISFSEHFEGEQATVEVSISYKYLEEDRAGTAAEIVVAPPPGFTEPADSGRYAGILRRGDVAIFNFITDSYSTDWTGQLHVNAEISPESETTASS